MQRKGTHPSQVGDGIGKEPGRVDDKPRSVGPTRAVDGPLPLRLLQTLHPAVGQQFNPICHGIGSQPKTGFIRVDHPGCRRIERSDQLMAQIGFSATQAHRIPKFEAGNTFGLRLQMQFAQNRQFIIIARNGQFTDAPKAKAKFGRQLCPLLIARPLKFPFQRFRVAMMTAVDNATVRLAGAKAHFCGLLQ